MTVDEEFNKLEDDIRRLKIEYEVYFNGGAPRPPSDIVFRVETVIKRYTSDQSKLSFPQRFRLTNLVQKYAVNAQLWRRRLQEKEEGRSVGSMSRRSAVPASRMVRVVFSNPEAEGEKIDQLLQAMKEARKQVGDDGHQLDSTAFLRFMIEKTRQVKETLACESVRFSIYVEEGKVKFKAAKAD